MPGCVAGGEINVDLIPAATPPAPKTIPSPPHMQATVAGGEMIGNMAKVATQMGVGQATAPLTDLSKGVINMAGFFGGQVCSRGGGAGVGGPGAHGRGGGAERGGGGWGCTRVRVATQKGLSGEWRTAGGEGCGGRGGGGQGGRGTLLLIWAPGPAAG